MKKLVISLLIYIPFFLFSQNMPICGYDLLVESYQKENPQYKQSIDQTFEEAKAWSDNNSFISNQDSLLRLPVVVHVLYENNDENISDDIIKSQIDVLNEDYKRLNADTIETRTQFDTLAGRANFEFFLATTDPNGNPTNGITRTSTTVSSFLDQSALVNPSGDPMDKMKSPSSGGVSAWPSDRYINIWVCDISINGQVQLLGYASPPNNLPNWPGEPPTAPQNDGLVIHYELFGRDAVVNFGSQVAFLGRVTTHEMGHFLGLRHIWGDGPCSDDDGIDDTPFSDSDAQNVCDHNKNSCVDSPYDFHDMIENYMDYSNPSCQNIFTKGQMGLIHGVLANQRVDLPEQTTSSSKPINPMSFNIYPNPSKEVLNVKIEKAENQSILQLLDVTGKIIWKKELNSNDLETFQLSTIKFARGVYFLQHLTESKLNNTKKVVLQ